MGIGDRDYMKRPSDSGGKRRSRSGATPPNPDGFLGGNRRFLIFVGGAIAILFLLKIMMNLLSE